ncbi:MAG: carboxymuconolactone decarboxylase family protein [Candidatus Thermoplasmatota archaeon]|nr:carboxymuconolactone decarboxylase family protein [Candidatus Thermoplasmatota archaeon]
MKKDRVINLEILDHRRRELVVLGAAFRSGEVSAIKTFVRNALDAGASKEDILKVIAYIIGDVQLFKNVKELLKVLQYEEARRTPPISVIDDVREN